MNSQDSKVGRDGFVIRADNGEEVGFVACDKSGHDRERVEAGLLSRIMQSGRGYIEDTRET